MFLALCSLILIFPLIVILCSYHEKHREENDDAAFQKYKHTVTIGTSVDYNRLTYFCQVLINKYQLNIDVAQFGQQEKQLELVKTIYALGFRKLRINFRWKDLSADGTTVDFNKISQILDYFESQNDLQLTLCFGPFKNFSYPEQYIPNQVIDKYLTKNKINIVNSTDEIVAIAKKYLNNLLEKLTTHYPQIIKQTTTFQTNNEGFHPFGSVPIKSTNQTEYEIIKLIEKYLPTQKIMFNTPIFSFPKHLDEILHPDIADMQSLITFLEQQEPSILFKSILGLNYYFSVGDGLHKTPLHNLDSITATQIVSTFTRNPTLQQFNAFISNIANKYQNASGGFSIKISELQEETWNGEFRGDEPGKTVAVSKKNITRLLSYINKIYPANYLSIDIWGAEQMAAYAYLHKTTSQTSEIFTQNFQKSNLVLQFYKENFKF